MAQFGEYRDSATGYCYRHPKRQSFVLCQRCGRTICAECQTPAAVGVICPECMREQRASMPAGPSVTTKARRRFNAFNGSSRPVMTYALIAICAVVFIFQSIPGLGSLITSQLIYAGVYSIPSGLYGVPYEPWRLITALFAHANIIHIALNMYTLWVFGQILEPMLGKWRYLWLFLIAGVAGNDLVMILVPGEGVYGASGALFGMMGALLLIQRKLGGPVRQLIVLIVINLVIGFLPVFGGTIAWQAHVGGLIGGLLVGLIYAETRQVRRQRLQAALIAVLGALVLAVGLVGPLAF